MPLRSYRPTSPGLRGMTRSTFEEITTKEPYKPLLEPQKRGSGRNNVGRLTVRHRGGGEKQHYRRIDFKRDKFGVPHIYGKRVFIFLRDLNPYELEIVERWKMRKKANKVIHVRDAKTMGRLELAAKLEKEIDSIREEAVAK